MLPDELLLKLKEGATSKSCRTLDAIYEICREQEARKNYDFSPATIARLGYKRGVPTAQSIRNKSATRYRALLQCFTQKHSTKGLTPKPQIAPDWTEEIANPKHRLLARMQASELAAAQSKLLDLIPPGTRFEIKDFQNEQQEGVGSLNSLERRALEYIASEEFLIKWHFSISDFGEILDSSGAVVMKAGTIDALKKALAYL